MSNEERSEVTDLKSKLLKTSSALAKYEDLLKNGPTNKYEQIPKKREEILRKFSELKEQLITVNRLFAGYNDKKNPVDFSDMDFSDTGFSDVEF